MVIAADFARRPDKRIGLRIGHLLQNLVAEDGMLLHLLPFVGIELAGLVENPLGDANFANIMQR